MRSDLLVWTIRGAGLAIGVALIGGTLVVASRASDVLLLVFLAILLASGLEPFVGWIRSRVPLGRSATILVVYAGFVVLVGILVFLLVPAALKQLDELSRSLPAFLQTLHDWAANLQPRQLATPLLSLIDAASTLFKPSDAPPAPDAVVNASLVVISGLVAIVTLLAIVFFWLVEHARLQRFALSFVPAGSRPGWGRAWTGGE